MKNFDSGLFSELKRRFELDQESIKMGSEKFREVCSDNTFWLEEQISKYGWLDESIVAEQGELYSWLIVQHSADLSFQKECLILLEKLPQTNIRKQHIAYLTDRILVNEGKEQIFGTQFVNGNLHPVKDREYLDKRRKQMGLEFEDKFK